MKTSEAQKKFADSEIVAFVGEYRGFKSEVIKWVDKKTGRAMTAPTLNHSVELKNGQAVAVSERVGDDFKAGEYVPPFKKGAKVLVNLTAFQNDKGLLRASGSLAGLLD